MSSIYDREEYAKGDIPKLQFIFTDLFPSADTVTAVSVNVDPTGGVTEVSGLRTTTAQVVCVAIDTAAGTVGTEYLIKVTAQTNTGRAHSLFRVLRVLEAGPTTAIGVSMSIAGTIYSAVVTQSGVSAPVATVNVNTCVGVPVWSRVSEGTYRLILADAFTSKIAISPDLTIAQVGGEFVADGRRIDDDTIEVTVRDPGGNLVDGWGPMYFEVKVYT